MLIILIYIIFVTIRNSRSCCIEGTERKIIIFCKPQDYGVDIYYTSIIKLKNKSAFEILLFWTICTIFSNN